MEAFIGRRAFALEFLTLFKFSFVGYLQNFDNACLRCFMASLHSSLFHGLLFFGFVEKYLENRSLIRSKLDYGSIIYGSARKSYLQMLDTVHNQGLRLALEAFRTSPVSSVNVEADEPSLWLRREKLSLQYAIRRC